MGILIGVFGTVIIMVRTGLAELPAAASWSRK
ncbi:Na+/H+ antiporter NhaA [Ensifer sp. 4252]